MLYATFNPPDDATIARTRDLYERVRCFDANMRARQNGYHVAGTSPFDAPYVDPTGEPWALLLDSELEKRKTWCMLPEYHRALRRELNYRHALDHAGIEDPTPKRVRN